MPKGSKVLGMIISANRDELVFIGRTTSISGASRTGI